MKNEECLHRRIQTMTQLEREILALVEERSSKHIKIDWQISIQAARTKLNAHYTAVQTDDKKFAES
jgi:FixJ family two-component response regulator